MHSFISVQSNDPLLSDRCASCQVAAWAVGDVGAPACARFGGSETSVIVLTASGQIQWWDTAMLKVTPLSHKNGSMLCPELYLPTPADVSAQPCLPAHGQREGHLQSQW